MKKMIVWALLATLMVAGSAFAVPPTKVRANASDFNTGAPATTNNDDSCDISVAPAATLLLPYFEVDIDDPSGENTLFTITNTSSVEVIAHVVLWTDYSYPVIDFNIFLTGYDVQSISLYDIIGRDPAVIAPAAGDREDDGTGTDISPNYSESDGDNESTSTDGSPEDLDASLDTSDCVGLPGEVPDSYRTRMIDAFTEGTVVAAGDFEECDSVGNVHDNAVGYMTIDVADSCGFGLPTDGDSYFSGATREIRWDNVLIGDYQQVHNANEFAQGNPMVHIRAIPEGTGDEELATNFARTFYSRYQDGDTADRRQPLPSTFAARYINGGPGEFQTYFKIWREGVTGEASETDCDDWADNGDLAISELVAFDEDENYAANESTDGPIISPPPPSAPGVTLPETSLTNVDDSDIYPQVTGANSGWMYLNLHHGSPHDPPISVPDDPGTPDDDETEFFDVGTQNWVIVSMRAEGVYSVDFDAAWLGNGCSEPAEISELSEGGDGIIGPAPDLTPAFGIE